MKKPKFLQKFFSNSKEINWNVSGEERIFYFCETDVMHNPVFVLPDIYVLMCEYPGACQF